MGPLRARINNKDNGTVAGYQAVKCRYIEGSKNGPVTFYLCRNMTQQKQWTVNFGLRETTTKQY